jgi:hypothetical protein
VEFLAVLPFRIALAAMALKQGMKIASPVYTLSRSLQQPELLIQFLLLKLFQNGKGPLAF